MKSYFILDCEKQQKIADSLYGYYVGITANKPPTKFWTHLTREQIKDYLSIDGLELMKWFKSLGLVCRDISFTMDLVSKDVGIFNELAERKGLDLGGVH